MHKLLLIDGNSLFHRAYHALPPITDRKGEMANAVFGFSNMLIKAINEVGPRYIACAFDTAAPTFRHIEFEKYKAQRPAPPPDLYPQLPKVKKVLDAFGIAYFEKDGFEADDLLATLMSKALGPVILEGVKRPIRELVSRKLEIGSKKRDSIASPASGVASLQNDKGVDQVVILSGDRDVLQLVDGNVKVQMPSFTKVTEGKPGWGVLMGAEEIREKFGLEPYQMVDYKSLIGDPSDNVPGVAGIGPKTAAVLLQKYHTLENLFDHVKETPLKVREKLEVGKDIAIAAKRLVELDRNVDLKFKIENLKFSPDWEKVRQEYGELGFKSILAKLPGAKNTSEVGSPRRFSSSSLSDLGVEDLKGSPREFTPRGSDSSEVDKTKEPKVKKKNNDDQLKLV